MKALEQAANSQLGDWAEGVCSQCGEVGAQWEHVAVGSWRDGADTIQTPHHRFYHLFGDRFDYCPLHRHWRRKPGMKIRQGEPSHDRG